MKIALFAYSRQGCRTARKVMEHFAGQTVQAFTMARFEESGFSPIEKPFRTFYGGLFGAVDAMIFVGSTGIAVREIAPHVRDKQTDPAVISIDELGHFCVPLLSGHIGGANDLARELANMLGAVPVITTATDINQKFSVDAWAARRGYAIASISRAKEVSAAILEQEVPLCCDFPIATQLANGLKPGNSGALGIYVGVYRKEPFEKTLRLIPPVLHLGIGCRKGTSALDIEQAVKQVLQEHEIDRRAICCVASIDLKKEEAGLLQFCTEWDLPVSFYTAEQLLAVEGAFTPSEFVRSITGVDNVCERAALLGAKELIVRKTAGNGVTVALAQEQLEVDF